MPRDPSTFSSVYVAGAILLWIEHKWPRATAADTQGTARALAEERRRERPEVTVPRDPVRSELRLHHEGPPNRWRSFVRSPAGPASASL